MSTLSPTSPRLAHRLLLRRLPLLLTLLAGVALLTSAPALAKKPVPCGQRVINDWEDGQIDKTYPVRCYHEALHLVSSEQHQYSSLDADIQRALQAAVNGNVPGGQIGNAFGAKYQQAIVHQRTINRLAQPFNHRDDIALPAADANPLSTVICVFAGCGTSASGLPYPLLILGGLAFLLLAAGAAGMVVRKLQDRRLPPPDNA